MTCKPVEEYGNRRAQASAVESAKISRMDTLCDNVKSLMESLKIPVEQVIKLLKISDEEQAVIMARLKG